MRDAAAVAETLGKCARQALIIAPVGPPGLPWFDIIGAMPRLKGGRSPSFYQALNPLWTRGLLHREIQPFGEDGRRPFDRFWLTREGIEVADIVAGKAGAA